MVTTGSTPEAESILPSGTPKREGRRSAAIAAAILASTAVLHGFVTMVLLPASLLAKYPVAARQYLQGGLSGERLLDYSPLYLRLHVLAQRAVSRPESWMHVLHVACSALAAVLLFFLLSRLVRPWIAGLGVLLFVSDRGLLAYLQTLEPEPILLVLLLAFSWFIALPRLSHRVLAGTFLGLALWTRPTFLPLLVVVPVYLYLTSRGRPILKPMVAFLVPVLLLVSALWVRNARAVGYFSPVVMNPGTVFFEGNNPNSWGTSSIYPPLVDEVAKSNTEEADYQHAVYRRLARAATGRALTVPEVNRYWGGMAVRFMRDHPRHAFDLLSAKLFHFFHDYQWHDVASAFWNERWLAAHRIPLLPFSFVSALAILGILAGVRRAKELILYYAILLVQLGVTAVTYVSARQQVGSSWVSVLFACIALETFTRSKGRLAAACAAALLLGALLHHRTDLMNEETRLWLRIDRSDALLRESYARRSEGRTSAAAAASTAALAAAPFYIDNIRPANLPCEPAALAASARTSEQVPDPSSAFDRAVLLVERGDADGAEILLYQVVTTGIRLKRDFYQSSEPYYYLARVALIRKDAAKAIELLQEAARRSPGDPSTLGLLHVLGGDAQGFEKLRRYFGEIDARNFVGRAALIAGAPEIAVENLQYVSRMLPDYRRGHVYLAAALGMAKRFEEGEAEYRSAMRLGGDPVMLEKEIVALFEAVAVERPQDPFARYSYGVVLRQFGHFQEALEVQEKAAGPQRTAVIEAEIAGLKRTISRALP